MKIGLVVSLFCMAAPALADAGRAPSSQTSDDRHQQGRASQSPSQPSIRLASSGDAEFGAYLASECVSCHRADGASEGIPSITGWPEPDFIAALEAYRAKERANKAMQLAAARLSDEEMSALAAYFAQAGE